MRGWGTPLTPVEPKPEFVITQKEKVVEVKQVKEPRRDYSTFCLNEDEVKKLVDAASSARDRAILLLMLHSALRRGEVAYLRIENIDWERRVIHLTEYKGKNRYPKNEEELTVPISDKCLEYLTLLKKDHSAGWLFVSQIGKSTKHLTPVEINNIVARIGKRAGLTNPIPQKHIKRTIHGDYTRHARINPHLLRHTCIRLYLKNGGDIRMAQKLARHSSIGLTLQTYGSPSVSDRLDDYRNTVKW